MKSYWKLLDLQSHEYTTHETEEEVNHIINYLTRDIGSDILPKEIVATKISTPFSNYEFIHVVVFENSESGRYHAFVYFFDSIEEQCDAFEEEIMEKNKEIADLREELRKIFNLATPF